MNAAPTWKLEGDYFEGCNCQSACPCIFLSDPSEGDCKLTIAWHIERGHYDATALDGLNVVGVFHTPGNMVSGPKWRAALYLDERASAEQSEALGQIFSGQVGGFPSVVASLIGEVLGVRSAPIEFRADGKRRILRIPSNLDLEIEAVSGADPEREVRVVNPALYGAPGFDPVVSRSTKYVYRDHGIEWENSGRSAFYSRFAYAPA